MAHRRGQGPRGLGRAQQCHERRCQGVSPGDDRPPHRPEFSSGSRAQDRSLDCRGAVGFTAGGRPPLSRRNVSMSNSADDLLAESASLVSQLGALAPPPQRTVDGTPGGVHRAARRGGGMEFAEHRDYVPGDELRHIDWRAYARSDRYTIKRFEQEVHASVTLLLDASASMHVGQEPPDKFEATKLLCAAIATWVARSGDAVGLVLAGRGVDLAPAGGRAQLRRVVQHLADIEADGESGFEGLDRAVLGSAQRRGTVIALSDLLADPAYVLAPLAQLRRLGPRVIVLCTLHPLELDLGFAGDVELRCAETAQQHRVDPRAVRSTYTGLMRKHLAALHERASAAGLELHIINIGDDPLAILRAIARALSRQRRAGTGGSWAT